MNDLSAVLGSAFKNTPSGRPANFPVELPAERKAAAQRSLAVLQSERSGLTATDANLDAAINQMSAKAGGTAAPLVPVQVADDGSTAQAVQPGQSPAASIPFGDLSETLVGAINGSQKSEQDARKAPPPADAGGVPWYKRFGQAAASLGDTILSAPGAMIQSAEYAGRRALGQSPETAQAGAASGFGESLTNPLGKTFGITNAPGYQNEASRQAMNFIGENLGKGADWIASKTGIPKADVENMMGTLLIAAPAAVKGAKGLFSDAPSVAEVRATYTGEQPKPTISSTLKQAMLDAAEAERPAPPKPTATQKAQATYRQAPEMEPRVMAGGGSAAATGNPYPVKFTGEEVVRGSFPQVKLSKAGLGVGEAEQKLRGSVIREILGDKDAGARPGAVTGSENMLRNEHTLAAMPEPSEAAKIMKSKIADEQNALSSYAQKRVEATGASPTLLNDSMRGEAINSAIYGGEDSLVGYMKAAKQSIYKQARDTVGDNPIRTTHVDNLLASPEFKAGNKLTNNTATVEGAADLIELARTVGFKDPVTGELLPPNSVAAWDAVRKSLNSRWTPSNKDLIRDINGAIDNDIASAGGPALYKLGSNIHKAEKTILGSRGIKTVFGEVDANGVPIGADFEKIPTKLNNMPKEQWRHIYDTLEDLSKGRVRGAPEGMPPIPPEVQANAARAAAEIRGALARQVWESGGSKAGVWNQNSVNQTLNSIIGEKITSTFSPDEVAAFHTLNYGGQFMPGIHGYEGAGHQTLRLKGAGFVERNAQGMATAAGAKAAGPIGAIVGDKAGGALARISKTRREAAQANRLIDIMNAAGK